MSTLPLILSLSNDMNRLSMSPFYEPFYNIIPAEPWYYSRRMNNNLRQQQGHDKDILTMPTVGKDGFQVCMDVSQYKPNELNVKVVDNYVMVEGKHEEREDEHGYISRHFVRRYALPKGYDAQQVASTLSSDGVLMVSVPKPAIEDATNERIVQIQQVGPAHLNVKANAKDDETEKEPQSKL